MNLAGMSGYHDGMEPVAHALDTLRQAAEKQESELAKIRQAIAALEKLTGGVQSTHPTIAGIPSSLTGQSRSTQTHPAVVATAHPQPTISDAVREVLETVPLGTFTTKDIRDLLEQRQPGMMKDREPSTVAKVVQRFVDNRSGEFRLVQVGMGKRPALYERFSSRLNPT